MADQAQAGSTNWFQVGLAALTQNVATGLAFGSFGTIVLAIEGEYRASRSQSSLCVSALLVSLSLTAWLLGRRLDRISIRRVMAAGATLGALAFALASQAREPWQLILVYLLLLGPATGMFGVLTSMTLASRWATPQRRGLAMGVVNMPVMVMIVPLAIAPVLAEYGVRSVYLSLAAIDLLLLPAILLVRDRSPDAVPEAPAILNGSEGGDPASLFRSAAFWTLVLAIGLMIGAGVMKLAHFVPLLTEQGRSFAQANLLLAISGGAGLFGSFIFGALSDRFGGVWALICNALIQAAMWTIFLAPVSYAILVADAVVVGACGGGVQAAFGVVLATFFGQKRFSEALGAASLLTLPFLFGFTPLASLIYEATGNYHLPMALMVGCFVVAAAVLASLIRRERSLRLPLANLETS